MERAALGVRAENNLMERIRKRDRIDLRLRWRYVNENAEKEKF